MHAGMYAIMGTIIASEVNKEQLLVDGQQRLTSLTFLLINLLKLDDFPDDQKGSSLRRCFIQSQRP